MSRFNDLTNQKYNMLTAIRFVEIRKKNAFWECRCDCGVLKIIAGSDLKRGSTKSCGCATQQLQANKKFKDLTGQVFGRLTVTKFIGMNQFRVSIYECSCSCGNIKQIERSNLIKGHTTSCGCYNRDKQLKAPGVATLRNYMNSYIQSATKRGYIFELTEEQFKGIICQDCSECHASPKEIARKYKTASATPILANGVDRINNDIGYVITNVQPMCTPCNMAKSNLGEKKFKEWTAQIRKSPQKPLDHADNLGYNNLLKEI